MTQKKYTEKEKLELIDICGDVLDQLTTRLWEAGIAPREALMVYASGLPGFAELQKRKIKKIKKRPTDLPPEEEAIINSYLDVLDKLTSTMLKNGIPPKEFYLQYSDDLPDIKQIQKVVKV